MDNKPQQDNNPTADGLEPAVQPVVPATPVTPTLSTDSPSSASSQTTDGRQVSSPKKPRKLLLLLAGSAFLVLVGGGGSFYLYSQQDHSIYAKSDHVSYDRGGVRFSLDYPSVLKSTASLSAKNVSFKVAYKYTDKTDKVIINVGALRDTKVLQNLRLTPAQFLGQIKSHSGRYVDSLNKSNPDGFKSLYAGCDTNLITDSKQTDVVCVNSVNGFTNVRVIGANTNYQYILQLYMNDSLWNNHQDIWQKVEKSFAFH